MTDHEEVASRREAGHPIATASMPRILAGLFALCLLGSVAAAEPVEEVVSFRCALAIDAVLARLNEQTQNPVIKEALDKINDRTGQMVCISMSADEIQVRLQSTEMTGADNRLVFSLDARSYSVRKTFYGR